MNKMRINEHDVRIETDFGTVSVQTSSETTLSKIASKATVKITHNQLCTANGNKRNVRGVLQFRNISLCIVIICRE